MKKNILEELYKGNIHPEEQSVFTDPAYRSLTKEIGERKEELRKGFDEEELDKYGELEGACAQLTSMEQAKAFAEGYKLATRLMVEALWDADDSNRSLPPA